MRTFHQRFFTEISFLGDQQQNINETSVASHSCTFRTLLNNLSFVVEATNSKLQTPNPKLQTS